MELKILKEKEEVLKRETQYQNYLISSCEGKLKRVDPLSEEFEETVKTIFGATDEKKEIFKQLISIKLSMQELEG